MSRSLVGIDHSSGLVIDGLTIQNLPPGGGSQAEALRLQSCDQCVVRNADIISRQDTLLWSGRVYADNCYIAGNAQFPGDIWIRIRRFEIDCGPWSHVAYINCVMGGHISAAGGTKARTPTHRRQRGVY